MNCIKGICHKNEVYIDVLESVNLLLSSTGTVLKNEVTGAVQLNTKLTGIPECEFGLNDKLVIDKEGQWKPGECKSISNTKDDQL